MWRGSNGPTDRLISSLVYMLPLGSALGFGLSLLTQFDFLAPLVFLITPFAGLVNSPFGFIFLFIGVIVVINNTNILHFIRYNVMQAFLLILIVTLAEIALQFFGTLLGGLDFFRPIAEIIGNTVFLGILLASGFSIFQTALGRYPEIPTLSDVVYTQIR